MLNQGVTPSRSPMAAHLRRPCGHQPVQDPAATLTTRCATLIVTVSYRFTNDLVAFRRRAVDRITRDPVGNRPEPGAEFATHAASGR